MLFFFFFSRIASADCIDKRQIYTFQYMALMDNREQQVSGYSFILLWEA
jgi:hypothetical protein